MMGMGEPLYNLDRCATRSLIVQDGEGIGISKRRITLSTSGVVPKIERAGNEIGCMLAVSLHAVRDELRNELVPLNRKYPIAALLEACRNYPGVSNARRITFEYVMLKGVNDSIDDAKALVRLLKGIPAKINLIPFNPWPGTKYECSDWEQIEKFSEVVFDAGYASPVRTPRGRDILAACGQLKSATEKLSARERMALRAMAMTGVTHGVARRIIRDSVRAVARHHGGRHRLEHRLARRAVAGDERRSGRARRVLGRGIHASGITARLLFLPMLIAVVLAEAFSIALAADLCDRRRGADAARLSRRRLRQELRRVDRPRAAGRCRASSRSRPRPAWRSASSIGDCRRRPARASALDANRRGRRLDMNRTGLLIALAVAANGGLVFGLFPQLDIAMSRASCRPPLVTASRARPRYPTSCAIARRC